MTRLASNARVAVIGAGIIGAAVALELRRKGLAVTLIDKGEPGMECSYGNGGAISPDFCVPSALPGMLKRVPKWFADPLGPLVVRWGRLPAALPWLVRWIRAGTLERAHAASAALHALHAPSLKRYAEILGAEAHGLIETTGQLYVWKTDRASPTEALARALRDRMGVVTHALNEAQIHDIDAELAPGYTRGLFFPDNGHTVNPLRLVQTLVRLYGDAGGEVMRRRFERFERENGAVRAIVCGGERLAVDAVVVAAGIRSPDLIRQLGDAVPLEAERGYHVMLPNPGVHPAIKISNRDHMFGLAAMEHGVRISGTVEFAGPDAPMDQRRADALLVRAKEMYPRLNGEGATSWMGSRPSTPDSLPVISRARRAPNVIYAFGHGHTGLTGAPMTAELVGNLLLDTRPSIDISPYRLDRF